ncbi:MAG: hypothetical protein FOGNACKC_03705 [Anaerolineae bacterium]|nr:hypothetical protein [Anaerolineae bacterium]
MKKFLSPKIIIPVVVFLLLVSAVGYILLAPSTWWKPFYVKMELDGASAVPEAQAATMPQSPVPAQPAAGSLPGSGIQQQPGIMYELDNKVVNLAEPGGLRYLQAAIVLELVPVDPMYYSLQPGEERDKIEEDFIGQIDARRPIIDDIITTKLSSRSFNEVATVEGKQALKDELMTAINDALGYQSVTNVYFTNFVVQ